LTAEIVKITSNPLSAGRLKRQGGEGKVIFLERLMHYGSVLIS